MAERRRIHAELANERVGAWAYVRRISAPVFNRYDEGDYYRRHEDNPIQGGLRTDLSFTLFLSDPNSYEGGALVLDGIGEFRCEAGALLIYPTGIPHEVREVVRGTRFAAVGWIESGIRCQTDRAMLRRFYSALDELSNAVDPTASAAFLELNRIRNELFRRWVEA